MPETERHFESAALPEALIGAKSPSKATASALTVLPLASDPICTRFQRRPSEKNAMFQDLAAFTLVELAVVIAIIGILGALALTAVSRAKGQALRIQCASNLRQLGILLESSVTANNTYPLTANAKMNDGGHYWMQVLQYGELSAPKTDNLRVWLEQDVWKCPAASLSPPWPTNRVYISYGYNGLGLSAESDTNGLGLGGHLIGSSSHTTSSRVSESEVVDPSEMMAIGDGFEGGGGIIRDGELIMWRNNSVTNEYYAGSTKRSYALHQGKANVVYCDGHVESPALHFLFEDTSDAALVRWNRDHQPHREQLLP
ncbi:MAG: prepilin-type N-terminal cleavage/methylation domain-containing protein [Verrucomicrobiota bacterium]